MWRFYNIGVTSAIIDVLALFFSGFLRTRNINISLGASTRHHRSVARCPQVSWPTTCSTILIAPAMHWGTATRSAITS